MTTESKSSNFRSTVESSDPHFKKHDPAPVASDTVKAVNRLHDSAGVAMGDLKDAASAATGDARRYAGAMASDAAAAFTDAVESNKAAGADAIASVARSAKSAADNIEKQSPQLASLVRNTADGVERISTDIRDRSMGEIIDSISDFAKRQPTAFFGCGILAGVVLARFLGSSNRSS